MKVSCFSHFSVWFIVTEPGDHTSSQNNITPFSPVYPLLKPVVYVQRRVAELFSIVCGNTESSPNPSIVCQGWE